MRATGPASDYLARIAAITAFTATLAVSSLASPTLALAQDTARVAAAVAAPRVVETDRIAEQLGARLANAQPPELVIGMSATGILSEPARLAALGLRDAKAGARVTIMRSGQDRLRVEVDEFDPVARTRRLTLHLDADGRVSAGTQ